MKLLVEGSDKICTLSLYNAYKLDVMPAFILIAENAGLVSLKRLAAAEGDPKYLVSQADYTRLYYLVKKIQKYYEEKARRKY